MTLNGTNISMVRGDDETLTVSITDGTFSTGDIVTFTVRQRVDDPILIQKEVTTFQSGKAVIVIAHADTESLDVGKYVYDIQLMSGGKITTIVKKSKFTLEEEVTY